MQINDSKLKELAEKYKGTEVEILVDFVYFYKQQKVELENQLAYKTTALRQVNEAFKVFTSSTEMARRQS